MDTESYQIWALARSGNTWQALLNQHLYVSVNTPTQRNIHNTSTCFWGFFLTGDSVHIHGELPSSSWFAFRMIWQSDIQWYDNLCLCNLTDLWYRYTYIQTVRPTATSHSKWRVHLHIITIPAEQTLISFWQEEQTEDRLPEPSIFNRNIKGDTGFWLSSLSYNITLPTHIHQIRQYSHYRTMICTCRKTCKSSAG